MARQVMAERSGILKQAQGRRHRRRRARAILWLLMVIIFLGELYWLAHWDRFLLREVWVSGASPANAEKIQTLTKQILADDYFGVWPRRNVLFYPRSQLATVLAANLPVLQKIEPSRVGNDLVIGVLEREPNYLWCNEGSVACFLLDETGFAFAPAPTFLGQPLFLIESDLPETPIGKRPLDLADFKKLLNLKQGLGASLTESVVALLPERVVLTSNNELKFLLPNGTAILLNLSVESTKLFVNLGAALSAPAFLDEYEDNLNAGKHLDYLDLRFANRIFYKFSD